MWRLRWWLAVFNTIKYFLTKIYTFFFTWYCCILNSELSHALGNQKNIVACFIILLTLLWWSRTENSMSMRSACVYFYLFTLSSVSFINILQFSECRSTELSPSWLNLVPSILLLFFFLNFFFLWNMFLFSYFTLQYCIGILLFFDAVVNGIVFFIF